ncbi:hypothetical protein N9Y92_02890 [Chlamydiales bacterium]|nr:hypothetical protein [Chlamydiales bacterium]
MNILPLIFSLLAILTIMTYSRVSGFAVSKAIQVEYHAYQRELKQQETQIVAEIIYHQKHEHKEKEGESERAPPVKATRRLNLFPLLDEKCFKNQPLKVEETKHLFSNLIEILYGETNFYKEALEKNPLIVEDFFRLFSNASHLHQKNKEGQLIAKKSLGSLDLEDEEAQKFLYNLLKDRSKESDEALTSDEEENKVLRDAFVLSPLKDLIEVKSAEDPIRIFLADQVLLYAIFGDATVVEEIVSERRRHFLAYSKDKTLRETLSGSFERRFTSSIPSWISPNSLNWEVSGTRPKK